MSLLRTRTLALALALAVPALAAPVGAQSPVPLGPTGGSIRAIRIDPDDPAHVLLGSSIPNVDGILGSTDGGLTWQATGAGLPAGQPVYGVASSGDDTDKVVALAGTGAYVSLDDGATFTLAHDFGQTMLELATHPTLPIWIATSALEAWRTDDGGGTWGSVFTSTWAAGSFYTAPVFAASNPSRAYLAIAERVWRSDDAGAHWTEMPHDFATIWALTVNPADADDVWAAEYAALKRSTDGAQSFAQHPAPYAWPFLQQTEALVFEPASPQPRLWMAVNKGLFTLAATGAWVHEDLGLLQEKPLALTLAFAGTNAWLGTYDAGVWRRADPTQSWQQLGVERVTLNTAVIPVPGGPQVVASAALYTRDAGAKFDVFLEDISTTQPVQKIVVDPTDPTRWFVARATGPEWSLIEVTGSGAAWSFLPLPGPAQTLRDVAFDPFDVDHILAGSTYTPAGVLSSTDGGASWLSNYTVPYEGTTALAFDPFQQGRVLGLSLAGELGESLDGGQAWTLIDTPALPGAGAELAFDPHRPGRVYRADAANGWSRSDDGGATWTPLPFTAHARAEIAFHPDQPDLVWLGDDGGAVWLSGLGGALAVKAFQTPAGTDVSGIALDPSDGTLLLATLGESAFELPGHAPYLKVGAGTPGTGGVAPRHFANGGLPQLGNAAWGLRVEDAQPGAALFVGVGLTEVALPVLGGVVIAGPPYALQLAGSADGSGAATFGIPLPATPSLAGASVVSQAIAADAGGPAGFAFSAGFRTTLMP